MEKEFIYLDNWLKDGHKAALAIVKKTWGSAPRQAGSIMVIRGDGVFEGSVSGGCIEGIVIAEAVNLIETRTNVKHLTFSVANQDAWSVGLACGGEIEILVISLQTLTPAWLHSALDTIHQRNHAYLLINTHNGQITHNRNSHPPTTVNQNLDTQNQDCLLQINLTPKPRIFIIGAVHIAQHLCVFAHETGFDITLIDPREGFIESREFKSANIITDWPDDYFAYTELDIASAVVALTHDPKLDDPALIPALQSEAFYIGALGSKKTNTARINRLKEAGFAANDINRIHGPIGLNIDAKTPAEIAVSIIAEIVQSYRELLSSYS